MLLHCHRHQNHARATQRRACQSDAYVQRDVSRSDEPSHHSSPSPCVEQTGVLCSVLPCNCAGASRIEFTLRVTCGCRLSYSLFVFISNFLIDALFYDVFNTLRLRHKDIIEWCVDTVFLTF